VQETKRCPRCELVLPRTEFYVVKTKTAKGWRYSSDCKSCQGTYAKQWKKDNPDKYKEQVRKSTIKHRYGLTIEQFDEMMSSQNNLCGICSIDITDNPYIDHCHNTGKVGMLLCLNCNTGLGQFKDSPEILQKALDYLLTNR